MSNITIQLSDIIVTDRARNEKEYGDIAGLSHSIKRIGMLQPLVLARSGDEYHLVAGGRRYKALQKLGVTELTHGATLQPGVGGFVFQHEVPEHTRREAELEENLQRLNMSWIDNVLLVEKTHKMKKLEKGAKAWGSRQTAELLGPGYGKSTVNYAIQTAKLIHAGDKEIIKCKSLQEALQLQIQRKENAALAELTKRAADKAKSAPLVPAAAAKTTATMPAGAVDISSFLDTFSVPGTKATEPAAAPAPVAGQAVAMTVQDGPKTATEAAVIVPLSSMFFLGDALQAQGPHLHNVMKQFANASFDHVVTDIPYGIDMDNLDEKQVASVKDTHDVDQNVEMMPLFLEEAFRVVKPNGFCVFCFDLDHWNFLQATAKKIGWKVQDWPVILCKTSPARNNAPQYNTTKNYEVAMYLRRSEKSTLRRPVTTSWRSYNFAAERQMYNNPFAKPFALWKDIYDDIAFTSQTVLDPFAGERSASRAAVNCGLVPYGIEISEVHHNRGEEHMKNAYRVIHGNNVEFV